MKKQTIYQVLFYTLSTIILFSGGILAHKIYAETNPYVISVDNSDNDNTELSNGFEIEPNIGDTIDLNINYQTIENICKIEFGDTNCVNYEIVYTDDDQNVWSAVININKNIYDYIIYCLDNQIESRIKVAYNK